VLLCVHSIPLKLLFHLNRLFLFIPGPLLTKCVGDANANAMDKGLDALGAWLIKADESQAAGVASNTCATMAVKCLKARPTTVTKVSDACMGFIELEQSPSVMEPLLKALGDKVPKAVLAALDIIVRAVSEFGTKVVDPKPLIKVLPSLFGHSNAGVRDKVKELCVVLASFMGRAVVEATLLDKMGDSMRKDVEAGISKAGLHQAGMRYTRKEAARIAAADASQLGGVSMPTDDAAAQERITGDDACKAEADMAYEISEPLRYLDALVKTKISVADDSIMFWDCFESKKWNVRKAALDKLRAAAAAGPRLSPDPPGDTASVVRELRKVLAKDANVACAAAAAECVACLARGLRKEFSQHAKQVLPPTLERLKEKQMTMSKAADDALRAILKHCVALTEVMDELLVALSHKTPKVRLEALKLLHDTILDKDTPNNNTTQKISQIKDVVAARAVTLASDGDGSVREAAQSVLVALCHRLDSQGSTAPLASHLKSLDDSKCKAIEAALKEKASVSSRPPATASATATTTAPPPPAAAAAAAVKSKPKPSQQHLSTKSSTTPGRSLRSSSSTSTSSSPHFGLRQPTADPPSPEHADAVLRGLLGDQGMAALTSSQWQQRVESMTMLVETMLAKSNSSSKSNSAEVMLCLSVSSGFWTEKNFQVWNKAFQLMTLAAQADPGFGKEHVAVVVKAAGEKIHEVKHKGPAGEALTAAAEAMGPGPVAAGLHTQSISGSKTPKVVAECLAWIATAVEEFGVNAFDSGSGFGVDKVISCGINALVTISAPPVRTRALELLGKCHAQLGTGAMEAALKNWATLKQPQMAAVREAFNTYPFLGDQYHPIRRVRLQKKPSQHKPKSSQNGIDETAGMMEKENEAPQKTRTLSLTPTCIDRLGSPSWKERAAALEEIEVQFKSSGGGTVDHSTVPPGLVQALRRRFTDTNRNLAAKSLAVLALMADAMPPPFFDRLARQVVLLPALTALSDSKKQVRDAVINLLDAWFRSLWHYPKLLIPFLATTVDSGVCNARSMGADGRTALLVWLDDAIHKVNVSEFAPIAFRAGTAALKDKSVGVREAGGRLVRDVAIALARSPGALDGAMGTVLAADLKLLTPHLPVQEEAEAKPVTEPEEYLSHVVNGITATATAAAAAAAAGHEPAIAQHPPSPMDICDKEEEGEVGNNVVEPLPPHNVPPSSFAPAPTLVPIATPVPDHYRDRSDTLVSRAVAEFENAWYRLLEALEKEEAGGTSKNDTEVLKAMCTEVLGLEGQAQQEGSGNTMYRTRAVSVIAGSVERLFPAILRFLGRLFDEQSEQTDDTTTPLPSRGCKYAINLMLQTIMIDQVAVALSQRTLRLTISCLLVHLVEEGKRGLLLFEEGQTLVRAVNVLLSKMLDSADPNNLFLALLLLLRDGPEEDENQINAASNGGGALRDKFQDLVIKCLIKLSTNKLVATDTQALNSVTHSVDVSMLLFNIHSFFMSLGVDEIRRRPLDDKPLRMVKSILLQLCKLLGYSIYGYMEGIPGRFSRSQTIIYAYVKMNLQTLEKSGAIAPMTEHELLKERMEEEKHKRREEQEQQEQQEQMKNRAARAVQEASQGDVARRLKGAVSGLVQRDPVAKDRALRELYVLKQEHPSQVERYLSGATERFRKYIDTELENLEASGDHPVKGVVGSGSGSGITHHKEDGSAGSASSAGSAGSHTPKKISSLRERLTNITQSEGSVTTSPSRSPQVAVQAVRAASSNGGDRSTVEELAARLQVLRQK
jgi:hypothetical protein